LHRIKKVAIETIRDCNGLCRICDYKDKYIDDFSPPKMSNKVFRAIVRKIKDLPCLETVCPYVHGEPLLDPKIFNRIRYIKRKLPYVRIEISTNGILLHKFFEKFCSLVDDRWISFHGIDKETYESTMGIPWDNGLKLRRLIESRPDKRFVMSIGLVGFSQEDAERFWRGYNVKVMTFVPRDRAGNIKSDSVESFYNPPTPDWTCWRFDKFLSFNTEGTLLPCSNDLKEYGMYGNYKMPLARIEYLRELYRKDNRDGYKTICWKCDDGT